jgi:hypothetical protein
VRKWKESVIGRVRARKKGEKVKGIERQRIRSVAKWGHKLAYLQTVIVKTLASENTSTKKRTKMTSKMAEEKKNTI